MPDAAFYFWAKVPDGDDAAFAREGHTGIITLPSCPAVSWPAMPRASTQARLMSASRWSMARCSAKKPQRESWNFAASVSNKRMRILSSVHCEHGVAKQSRWTAPSAKTGSPRRDVPRENGFMARRLCGLLLALLASGALQAATPAEIDYTLQQILAGEGALYLTHSISDSGRVILLFGINEPDWHIENTVKALQLHPDIPGLIRVKTDSGYCSIR